MRTFLPSVLVCMASLSLATISMAATISIITPPSGYNASAAFAINSSDAVTGYIVNSSNGSNRAYYFSSTGTLTTLPLISGGTEGIGRALNDSNQVVGSANTTVSVPSGYGTYRPAAFSWTASGGIVELNSTNTGAGNGINNAGTATGYRRLPITSPPGASPETLPKGFARTSGGTVSDAPIPDDYLVFGYDINNASTPLVVGMRIPETVLHDTTPVEAWVWSLGASSVTYFSLGGSYGAAYAVNDSNYVVGTSMTAPDLLNDIPGNFHAFLRSPSTGVLQDLHPSGSWTTSTALGINSNNVVVGYLSNDSAGYAEDSPYTNTHQAFVWDSSNGIRLLYNLIPSGSKGSTSGSHSAGWLSLEEARDVNTGTGGSDPDKIVGFGQYHFYDSTAMVWRTERRGFIVSM